MLEYKLSDNNLKIIDSYTVKKRSEMGELLFKVKYFYPSNNVFRSRSISNLIREWRGHNLLYNLNIKRDRTKDVDLNADQKWYENIGYYILSILYL